MLTFFFGYIKWHYSQALRELFGNIKKFLKFIYNFFSIRILTTTLFSPWLGLGERYKKDAILDFADHLSSFVVNTMMRFVGLGIRIVFIAVGLVAMVCAAVVGIIVVLLWILYPIFVILFLFSGLRFIIESL